MNETHPDTAPLKHWTQAQIVEVWNKGTIIQEFNNSIKRDKCGLAMKFAEASRKRSNFGWEIDFIIAVANGQNECTENHKPLPNNAATNSNKMVHKVIRFVEELSARSKTRSEFDKVFISEANRLVALIKPDEYSGHSQKNVKHTTAEGVGNGSIDMYHQIEFIKYQTISKFVMNICNSKSF